LTTEAPKRTGRKGIPNHPIAFRREIARLASEPGVSVAGLAMEHGLNANLVFKWRRSLRAGEYDSTDFLPVVVDVPQHKPEPSAPAPAPCAPPPGTIEISTGGIRMRIEGAPDEATLLLVLHALRGTRGAAA